MNICLKHIIQSIDTAIDQFVKLLALILFLKMRTASIGDENLSVKVFQYLQVMFFHRFFHFESFKKFVDLKNFCKIVFI